MFTRDQIHSDLFGIGSTVVHIHSVYRGLACEQGEERGEKGEKKDRRERGACRNTPMFRLQQLYNLCGTIN